MNASLLVILLASVIAVGAQSPIETARAHVRKHAVFRDDLPEFAAFMDPIEAQLGKGREAQTTTMSFVYGIRRHAKNLLGAEQAERWQRLLDSRAPEIKRLHDERNVLRGFFFSKAWELPLVSPSRQGRLMAELQAWLEVWLDSAMHERIAQHRLCRDAFEILTSEQRGMLASGRWDEFVRKSTGHKRAYFGDRMVLKALGEPSDPVRFQVNSDHLRAEQAKVQKKLLAMEARWRRLSIQAPSVADPMMVAEWYRTSDALGAFFLNQVTNIHVLCRAGYQTADPAVRARIAAQSARELALVSEKVRTNLTAGAQLHAALVIARERTHAARNPPLPAELTEACRAFAQQPDNDRVAQLDRMFPLAARNGSRSMLAVLRPELSVDRLVKLLGPASWVRTFDTGRAAFHAHTYSCGTNSAGRQVEILVVEADGGMIMRTENSMLSTAEQAKYPDQVVPRMKPHLDRIVRFAKADRSRVGRVALAAGFPPVAIDNLVELEQSGAEPVIFIPMRVGRGGNAVGYLYHPGLTTDGKLRVVPLPTGSVNVMQSFGDGWHWAGRNRD